MTSTGESNLNLTREQLEILKFVRKGHNLVITGQAGVGKSRVVSRPSGKTAVKET